MHRLAAAAAVAAATALAALAAGASDQGLTPQEQEKLFHLPEGIEGLPYLWLQALEDPHTHRPFWERTERFGTLADPASKAGLPVGWAEVVPVDLQWAGVRMVGITCMGCHTGEVRHNGRSMRIVGAPAMFDADAFKRALHEALTTAARSPAALMKFVKRMIELEAQDRRAVAVSAPHHDHAQLKLHLGELGADQHQGSLGAEVRAHLDGVLRGKHPAKATDKLHAALAKLQHGARSALAKLDPKKRAEQIEQLVESCATTARLLEARAKDLQLSSTLAKEKVLEGGPGRVDAFGTLLHRIYSKQGVPPPYAPTSYPEVWDAQRTPWYHWDGNTDSILERNAGNARGLGFIFEEKNYASTVLTRNLHEAERLVWKLQPPVWPEQMLGRIDAAKKAQGEQVFKKSCAGCHVDKVFQLVEVAQIGTDPLRAQTTAVEIADGHGGKVPALIAAVRQIEHIVAVAYQREKVTPDEAVKFRFGRPAKGTWRITKKYRIPSLRGVWATAPYLHNGSVPTLYDLLQPAAQRPTKFLLGSYEFDSIKVGYTTKSSDPLHFEFDATKAGNHNTGHDFGAALTAAERASLLEYLKTL